MKIKNSVYDLARDSESNFVEKGGDWENLTGKPEKAENWKVTKSRTENNLATFEKSWEDRKFGEFNCFPIAREALIYDSLNDVEIIVDSSLHVRYLFTTYS